MKRPEPIVKCRVLTGFFLNGVTEAEPGQVLELPEREFLSLLACGQVEKEAA